MDKHIVDKIFELKDKYNGKYSASSDTMETFCIYFFIDIQEILNSFPKDILEFLSTFPYLVIRGWVFNGIYTLDHEERLVSLGGIYHGLGYRSIYAFDRKENNIKLVTEGNDVLRQYKTWTDALKELIEHEFDWKFATEKDQKSIEEEKSRLI